MITSHCGQIDMSMSEPEQSCPYHDCQVWINQVVFESLKVKLSPKCSLGASFVIIRLTRVHSQKDPSLHFGKSFTLSRVLSSCPCQYCHVLVCTVTSKTIRSCPSCYIHVWISTLLSESLCSCPSHYSHVQVSVIVFDLLQSYPNSWYSH